MRLPLKGGAGPATVDTEQLTDMVDLFISRGFNYFDTAATYCDGASEPALRKALVERYPREAYILADKLPTMNIATAAEQNDIFERQLRECGVDCFDRYIVHCATAAFYERAEELGSFAFAAEKRREGRVKSIGFSFHDSPELLERILTEHPETDFVQLQVNYVDWTHTPIRSRECCRTARRHGVPVTVMCALKGGLLADLPISAERLVKSVSGSADAVAWALRFAASIEGVDCVLSGMSSIGEMERNTKALSDFKPFTAAEYAAAEDVADTICGSTPVQCTSCGYCLPVCPSRIAIPDCLHLYNSYSRMFGGRNYGDEYAAITDGRGLASECISCGRCERTCPQHLNISGWIGRVADAFECRRIAAGV